MHGIERGMSLGARMRTARKALNLTARDVDRRAGLARGHAAAIERGVYTSPQVETVEVIARVLGVTVDSLLSKDATDESGPLPDAPAATGTDDV